MTMQKKKLLNSFRYVYLLSFFLLLSGVFSPLITARNYENVFVGTTVLFAGLLGGIVLYNGITKQNNKFIIIGLLTMGASLAGIMMLSGYTS